MGDGKKPEEVLKRCPGRDCDNRDDKEETRDFVTLLRLKYLTRLLFYIF